MRSGLHTVGLFGLIFFLACAPALAVSDNFASDPLALGSPWSFGIGNNANGQFSWNPGALTVHLDSSLPTARLDQPLGVTLNDSANFRLSARFSFQVLSAPADQSMQIAFGLTSHALTGGDRTGTPSNFKSANTIDTVEFNYFPNVTQFGGPTLTPTVFGGMPADGNVFHNFDALFGSMSDNTTGLTSLPQQTTLEARLIYDGASKVATLDMYQVVGSALVLLDTGVGPLGLTDLFSSYDPSNPFAVDTLSIMAYHDGFTTADDKSLVANVTFQSIALTVPEPPALVLSFIAGLAAVAMRFRASRVFLCSRSLKNRRRRGPLSCPPAPPRV